MVPGLRSVAAAISQSTDALSELIATRPGHDRPIRVLVLIPSLAVGGAETDLVRTLPRIDRRRFKVTVCTFLDRGELGAALQAQGIEVIGPLSTPLYSVRLFVRAIFRPILSPLRRAARVAKFDALRQVVRLTAASLSSLLKRVPIARDIGGHLRRLPNGLQRLRRALVQSARALFWSPRAITYLADVVRLARPIAQHIRALEIDIVHTILPNSYLVGACASVLAGRRPILMSRLSLNVYQQNERLIGFIEKYLLHHTVDAAIGNSHAILRELNGEGVHASKLHLVYNGIDARTFSYEMVARSTARRLLNIPDDALVFSVVANLHPYKGHRDLLLALAPLSKALRSDWVCLIVGNDTHDLLPELLQLCRDSGLSRHVRFLGARRDVPTILSASDIHISASHQEGLPNNIIEAMCARLPVVATAVGGVPELVIDGETGYLLPPHNAGQMTDALLALARAPGRRATFGAAGYARALTHFSLDRNVAAFETIYAGLAGGHPHKGTSRTRDSQMQIASA
jgi:glycosyltransferase involved in cell wall biosynthesis